MLTAVPNAATSGNHQAEAKRSRKSTTPEAIPAAPDAAGAADAAGADEPLLLPSRRKTTTGTATTASAMSTATGLETSPLADMVCTGSLHALHPAHGTHLPPGSMHFLQLLLSQSFPALE